MTCVSKEYVLLIKHRAGAMNTAKNALSIGLYLKNCCLVGVWLLVIAGKKSLVERESTGGWGNFSRWGRISKFLAIVVDSSPSAVIENGSWSFSETLEKFYFVGELCKWHYRLVSSFSHENKLFCSYFNWL